MRTGEVVDEPINIARRCDPQLPDGKQPCSVHQAPSRALSTNRRGAPGTWSKLFVRPSRRRAKLCVRMNQYIDLDRACRRTRTRPVSTAGGLVRCAATAASIIDSSLAVRGFGVEEFAVG